METVSINLQLPRDILIAANISEANAPADIKKCLALHMFRERVLSFGKAAELSGMSKLEFMELVGSRGVSLNYDVEDYFEDVNALINRESFNHTEWRENLYDEMTPDELCKKADDFWKEIHQHKGGRPA